MDHVSKSWAAASGQARQREELSFDTARVGLCSMQMYNDTKAVRGGICTQAYKGNTTKIGSVPHIMNCGCVDGHFMLLAW